MTLLQCWCYPTLIGMLTIIFVFAGVSKAQDVKLFNTKPPSVLHSTPSRLDSPRRGSKGRLRSASAPVASFTRKFDKRAPDKAATIIKTGMEGVAQSSRIKEPGLLYDPLALSAPGLIRKTSVAPGLRDPSNFDRHVFLGQKPTNSDVLPSHPHSSHLNQEPPSPSSHQSDDAKLAESDTLLSSGPGVTLPVPTMDSESHLPPSKFHTGDAFLLETTSPSGDEALRSIELPKRPHRYASQEKKIYIHPSDEVLDIMWDFFSNIGERVDQHVAQINKEIEEDYAALGLDSDPFVFGLDRDAALIESEIAYAARKEAKRLRALAWARRWKAFRKPFSMALSAIRGFWNDVKRVLKGIARKPTSS